MDALDFKYQSIDSGKETFGYERNFLGGLFQSRSERKQTEAQADLEYKSGLSEYLRGLAQQEKASYTGLYVLGGLTVLAITGVAIYAIKKKKG